MPTEVSDARSFHVHQELTIDAPPEVVFESILEELGPGSEMPDGSAFPMKLEAWPGGRWYRDLGGNKGHLWGHVQVIKPPTLLEICGPMFMSYPVSSHVQYRVTPATGGALLTLHHRALGMIPDDHMEGVHEGWAHGLNRVREIAIRKFAALRGN
ncbi:MAG: SRPBCC family protein [Phycisphaerales bacterium]